MSYTSGGKRGFPKLGPTLFGGPYKEDYHIRASLLRSQYLGKYHIMATLFVNSLRLRAFSSDLKLSKG